MASTTEICLNCHQPFYQQSLNPLKLQAFQFAGCNSPSLASYVESSSNIPGNPKVCNTCLALIKISHLSSKRMFLEAEETHNVTAYACAACRHLSPANNLMIMRLTVVRLDGCLINLEECARICMRSTIRADVDLMVCLACMSVIFEEYQQRAAESKTKAPIGETVIKQETMESGDYVVQTLPQLVETSYATVIKTEVPEVAETKPIFLQQPLQDHICPICHEDFPSYNTRERHRRKVHGKDRLKKPRKKRATYSCAHCPSKFNTKSWLTIHMNNHRTEMLKFQCHHCPKWYRTKRQVRDHLDNKHYPKKVVARKTNNFHSCGICSGIFYDRHEYQKHLKGHEELEKLQCAGCKRVFKSVFVYIRHVQTRKEVFSCTKCDAAAHTKTALDRHMRLKHNASYVCEICDLPLYTRYTFEAHQQTRHGIAMKSRCKRCGEMFESREKLREHTKMQHPNTRERPFVCDQCGRAAATEHDLKVHLESHAEKLECHLCGKKLKNSDTLANHMTNIHSGRKLDKTEYPCPKCPLRFERRQFLEGHMIVHNTENRPFFQCNQCGIAYTRRQKLQIHVGKCPKNRLLC